MAEFETPIFLQNHSPEEVHGLMRMIMPRDLDMSQGGHAYNLTMPTALAIAELCEFVLPEVIKLIFPETSYGQFVDAHARVKGMTRRAARAASGKITITGQNNAVIPEGSLFSTASINGAPSVEYKTMDEAKIPSTGSVTVDVVCTQAGVIGNTATGTIVLVASRLTGVTGVTNEEPLTGGTEEESDESLIARIVEFNKSQGESYAGTASDYKRWAMSVDGVGSATIVPAQDTSGLVTIIVTDANGDPATEDLRESVYNYIMNPDNPNERLAPVNALLQVSSPESLKICVKATVELSDGATLDDVKAAYVAQLELYMSTARDDGEVKYSRIAAILASVEGVSDYTDLTIGGMEGVDVKYSTTNIPITASQIPVIISRHIILTAGSV